MAASDVTQKTEIYHTLYLLNLSFSRIVAHCQTLQKNHPFKPKSAKLFSSLAQELQAEINQDFLEDLHQIELDDWNRFGKVRQARDKELRDPDDVFIEAEERKKQLAKQHKKTSKKGR